ncbi:MAG: division/cell wall cluster transcriptional repressor MraZ [Clostridia bacterium]|nr:division/cell wall cluster transcriptional repressor MraZ [Clostridia bacterium]MBQ5813938.1 division/cell wall cluster transcriptional repressor MraZ [Clostridia bacterium]MBQ9966784.1 division/cell wall cluster transcriptional repressor MraZ [Clostridia bacterium]
MVRGEYAHSVDSKGRMIFPAKLREELGEGFVIFKGLDGCIWAYTKEDWDAFEDKIASLPVAKARKLQRFYSANYPCEPDGQGRILIPQSLRTYAGITKDVIIAGVQRRVEIWDAQRWQEYNDSVTEEEICEIMEEENI